MIRILTHVLKIHSVNKLKKYINLKLKLLNTGMNLTFISVNNMGSPYVRTN